MRTFGRRESLSSAFGVGSLRLHSRQLSACERQTSPEPFAMPCLESKFWAAASPPADCENISKEWLSAVRLSLSLPSAVSFFCCCPLANKPGVMPPWSWGGPIAPPVPCSGEYEWRYLGMNNP